MSGMTPAMMLVGSYAEMRAHFLVDIQLWSDDVVRETLPPGDYPFTGLTFEYTNAIAAIRRGDLAATGAAISRVDAGRQHAKNWMEQQKMDAPQMNETLLIATDQLGALLAAAEGKPQDAAAQLQRIAARERALPLEFGPPTIEAPSDELLGDLLLQLHRPAEAREAFQAALARAPGRRPVLEALARTDKEIASAAAAKDAARLPPANTPPHNP